MRQTWGGALYRLLLWTVPALLVGQLLDHPLLGLSCGLIGVLGWQVWQLLRLARWVDEGDGSEPPHSSGLWGQLFEALYQRQRTHRRYQERLQNIINEFQASTAALPDATVALDAEGRITWCNEAAVTLLGFHLPQDLGQPVANLLRSPRFAAFLQARNYREELVLPSPLDINLQLSLRVVSYGHNQRLLLARDITKLIKMERVRRDFVANASHELRTPLTVIRGYLEVLDEDSKQGPLQPWNPQLGEMRSQASRMSRIIDDMLKLARLEANGDQGMGHEEVDVSRMLRSIQDEARAMSKGRHRIELDAQSGLRLLGHGSELHSIFSNLVFNAIQYTPAGGEIRIRCWTDARGAHYSVTDTGIGIEPQHLPRLTERFYRVDTARSRATGGTGLGLAIVKHALEHHEGRLEITSVVKVGSTFTCHFPASRLRMTAAA